MWDHNKRKTTRKLMPEPRVFINGIISGFLEDISPTGAGMVLNHTPGKNQEFEFTIDFGKWVFFRSITVKQAKVAWTSPYYYENLSKVGVEFDQFDPEEREKLENFLNFWDAEEGKITSHIENLEKITDHAKMLNTAELQRILAQLSFLRVIPLSNEVNDLVKNINVSRKLIKTLDKITEMGSDELRDLETTINAFENAQNFVYTEMQQKEEVIDAYEKLQDFMRNELIEKDRMLQMSQKVLDMANQEKREKDKTIRALESIAEMMRAEQIEKNEIIEAHEKLQEIYRREMMEKESLIEAFEELQKLHNHEIMDREEILEMHKILEKLAQNELLEKDQEIRVRDMLSDLAREEIMERQKVIDAYDQFAGVVKEEILYKDSIIETIQKTRKDFSYENE
jgi:hypothetical protein